MRDTCSYAVGKSQIIIIIFLKIAQFTFQFQFPQCNCTFTCHSYSTDYTLRMSDIRDQGTADIIKHICNCPNYCNT